jgi:hypothetical protein
VSQFRQRRGDGQSPPARVTLAVAGLSLDASVQSDAIVEQPHAGT